MKQALVIGTHDHGVEGDMVAPFETWRDALRRRHGLEVRRTNATELEEIRAAVSQHRPDVAFVMTSWARSAEETLAFFARWHRDPERPRIVYLDSFDSSSSPFFPILPYVDCYVKKQLLRDLSDYQRELRGGYVFTEHLARQGHDLAGWSFGSKVPAEHADRIRLGWNLGVSRRLESRLRSRRPRWLRPRKDIDVGLRMGLGPSGRKEWYYRYRRECLDALAPLAKSFRVLAVGYHDEPTDPNRVSSRRYHREMARTRIAFSPFGWGELCWRDFEAVCHDCLLVKPDVSHLVTEPDIFVPGETYVPVAWDLSNLEETCRHYLGRPDEMARIVEGARRRYLDYFESLRFVDTVGEILETAFRSA